MHSNIDLSIYRGFMVFFPRRKEVDKGLIFPRESKGQGRNVECWSTRACATSTFDNGISCTELSQVYSGDFPSTVSAGRCRE